MSRRTTTKKKTKKGKGILQKVISLLPQMHIPTYRYCGPNTKLTGNRDKDPLPINRIDAICQIHDYDYLRARHEEDYRRADCKMLMALEKVPDLTIGEKIGKQISKAGIKMKVFLEGKNVKKKGNGQLKHSRRKKN